MTLPDIGAKKGKTFSLLYHHLFLRIFIFGRGDFKQEVHHSIGHVKKTIKCKFQRPHFYDGVGAKLGIITLRSRLAERSLRYGRTEDHFVRSEFAVLKTDNWKMEREAGN